MKNKFREVILNKMNNPKRRKLLQEHPGISIDPQIMGGTPVIKGTRIPVCIILEMLEGKNTFEEIRKQYPTLINEDVKAAIHFSSSLIAVV